MEKEVSFRCVVCGHSIPYWVVLAPGRVEQSVDCPACGQRIGIAYEVEQEQLVRFDVFEDDAPANDDG